VIKMKENPLIKLIKEGKIATTEDGKIIGFNEYAIFLPVRVLNKLLILLKENFGEDKAHEILKELGRFQVRQAFQRYLKIMGWKILPKDEILEFVKKILMSLGLGEYTIRKADNIFVFSISKSPLAEEFLIEYGKQEYPIDYYIAGGLEAFLTALLGKPMICEEVKCYAKGDDCCEFVVKPKE